LARDYQVQYLNGVKISICNGTYNISGTSYKYVADDETFWLPDPSIRKDVFRILQGTCEAPASANGIVDKSQPLQTIMGMASWAEIETNPTCMKIFCKWNALPIIKDGYCHLWRDVTP
jgi:hypothetical protein